MSRACQNRLKQRIRRRTSSRKSLAEDLRHHCQEPEQARGHVKTVAANQREEGRQERTPGRPGATLNETGELAGLKAEEGRPERESRAHGGVEPCRFARAGGDGREAACEAREEKAGRLRSRVREVEELRGLGTARRVRSQYRIGGKERREHDNVAEQENPEAETYDDALGRRTASSMARRRPGVGASVAEPVGIAVQ